MSRAAEPSPAVAVFALLPLVAAPLLVGGVHREALAVLVVLWVPCVILALLQSPRARWPLPVPLTVAAAVAVVWPALQLVPLPEAVLRLVAPTTADWLEFLGRTAGESSSVLGWRPISLAPSETLFAIGRRIAFLLHLLLAIQVFHPRRHRRWGIKTICVVGLVSFAIGLVQTLLGAERILGWYMLRDRATFPFMATFVNDNFQAGFYAMSGLVSLGLAQDRRTSPRWKAIAWAGAICGVAGTYLTTSRGAMLIMPVSLLSYAAACRSTGRGRFAIAVAAAFAGALLVVWLTEGAFWGQLATLPGSAGVGSTKLELWGPTSELIREFWTAGVGAGGFRFGFPHFGPALSIAVTVTSPENLVLAWLAELGVPMGIAFLSAGAWGLWLVVRRQGIDTSSAGAGAAILFIVVHNMFDYSLSSLGVAIPVATLGAFLLSPRARDGDVGATSTWVHVPAGALAILLVPLAGIALRVGVQDTRSPSERHDETIRLAYGSPSDAPQAQDSIADLIRDFPASHQGYSLRAQRFARPGPAQDLRAAMSNANRALFLHSRHAVANATVAEILLQMGRRGQGIMQFGIAARSAANPRQRQAVLDRLLQYRPSLRELAVVAGSHALLRRAMLEHLIRRGRAALALEALDALGFAGDANDSSDAATVECRVRYAADDRAGLSRRSEELMVLHPDSAMAWFWGSRAARLTGRRQLAIDRIRVAQGKKAPRAVRDTLLHEEGVLLFADADEEGLLALVVRPADSADVAARLHCLLARILARKGRSRRAIGHYRTAVKLGASTWLEPRLRLARLLTKEGNLEFARLAYEAVLGVNPGHSGAQEGLSKINQELGGPVPGD